MKKYIEQEKLIDALMMYTWRDEEDREIDDADEKRKYIEEWFPNVPAADVVDRDCYNRVLKENDTMREQLAKIGKKPGDSMDNVRPVINARKIKFYNNPWTDRKFTTCAACHGKVGPHDKFCKHCGAKFEEAFT